MWAIAGTCSRYSRIRCHVSSIRFFYEYSSVRVFQYSSILWGGNVNQLFSFNPIEGNYVPHDNAQVNEFRLESVFAC